MAMGFTWKTTNTQFDALKANPATLEYNMYSCIFNEHQSFNGQVGVCLLRRSTYFKALSSCNNCIKWFVVICSESVYNYDLMLNEE